MIYIFQIGDVNIRRLINQTQTDRLVNYNYTIQEFDEGNSAYVQGDSQTRDTVYSSLKYTIQGKADLNTLEKLSYLTNSKDRNSIPVYGLKVLDDSIDLSDNSSKQKYQIVYNLCRVIKIDENNEPQIENLFKKEKNRDEYSVKIILTCKTTAFHNIEESLEVVESRKLLSGEPFIPLDSVLAGNIDRTHFVNKESLTEDKDYYICKGGSRLFSLSLESLDIQQVNEDSAANNYIYGTFGKSQVNAIGFKSSEDKLFYPPGSIAFNPLSTTYAIYADIKNTGTKRADKALLKLSSQERYIFSVGGNNIETNIETGVFDKSGQFFQIYNETTKTGFRITWNKDYKSPIVFYRTHSSELFVRKVNFADGFSPDSLSVISTGYVSFGMPEGSISKVFIRNYRQLMTPIPYTPGVESTLSSQQYSWDIATGRIYFSNINNGLNVTIETVGVDEIVSGDYLIYNGSLSVENISDFNNGIFELSGLDNELDDITAQLNTFVGSFGTPSNSVPGLSRKRQIFNIYCPVQYIQN